MNSLVKENILRYNRQPQLTSAFEYQLDALIEKEIFNNDIATLTGKIVEELSQYREESGISKVYLGISGGIDSALTAALFKRAGYMVTGVTMPIIQKQEETDRGFEVCAKLGIDHINKDLSQVYTQIHDGFMDKVEMDRNGLVRAGNLRARTRMMYLYDLANKHGGFVASTDNLSELAAGFWTLHGDVGDVAPIQSLTKSWEVPAMAEFLCVPNSVIEAVPTDGLGITASDEDSFGFSYLEFDLVLLNLMYTDMSPWAETPEDQRIVNAVKDKIRTTTFKRANPVNLNHPLDSGRFGRLQDIDKSLRHGNL